MIIVGMLKASVVWKPTASRFYVRHLVFLDAALKSACGNSKLPFLLNL